MRDQETDSERDHEQGGEGEAGSPLSRETDHDMGCHENGSMCKTAYEKRSIKHVASLYRSTLYRHHVSTHNFCREDGSLGKSVCEHIKKVQST